MCVRVCVCVSVVVCGSLTITAAVSGLAQVEQAQRPRTVLCAPLEVVEVQVACSTIGVT